MLDVFLLKEWTFLAEDHRSRIWWLIMLNLLIIFRCALLTCPRLCPHMFFLNDQLADL